METVDDILSHYGVKGMKWGVRKDRKISPAKMRYESLSYDQERGMFVITVTALGDDDE